MIEARRKDDYETYSKIYEFRDEQLKSLLRIEADLVYYGHFSRADISSMKVFERRFHISELNRKAEERNKNN